MTAPRTLDEYRREAPGPDTLTGGMRDETARPLLSVVTAVFNRRATLPRTLDSVIGQSFKNVEHIAVDGASTDGTLGVLRAYNERLAYWVSEPDSGLYDAMNRGVALSRGDYISILNSDDYYAPGALNAVAAAIAETQADVVFGDYIFVLQDVGLEKRIVATDALDQGMSLGHALFIARRVYERLGLFDTRLAYSADLEFALRMRASGVKFAKVPAGPALQYFTSGGTAEQHLAEAAHEATRLLAHYAGGPAGICYGLRALRRVASRGMLELFGSLCGRAAYLQAKARYYAANGYVRRNSP